MRVRCFLATALVMAFAGCSFPAESLDSNHATFTMEVLERDGRIPPSAVWGAWSAPPGARLVEDSNVLLVRAGSSDQNAIVRFDAPAFTGATDAGWAIPIQNNTQLAAWQIPSTTRACGDTPSEAWESSSRNGAIAIHLTRAANTCVAYRILALPVPLEAQWYNASYTVEPT